MSNKVAHRLFIRGITISKQMPHLNPSLWYHERLIDWINTFDDDAFLFVQSICIFLKWLTRTIHMRTVDFVSLLN